MNYPEDIIKENVLAIILEILKNLKNLKFLKILKFKFDLLLFCAFALFII